jgi:hypothetical protein
MQEQLPRAWRHGPKILVRRVLSTTASFVSDALYYVQRNNRGIHIWVAASAKTQPFSKLAGIPRSSIPAYRLY